jgi:hypothetical protein
MNPPSRVGQHAENSADQPSIQLPFFLFFPLQRADSHARRHMLQMKHGVLPLLNP